MFDQPHSSRVHEAYQSCSHLSLSLSLLLLLEGIRDRDMSRGTQGSDILRGLCGGQNKIEQDWLC